MLTKSLFSYKFYFHRIYEENFWLNSIPHDRVLLHIRWWWCWIEVSGDTILAARKKMCTFFGLEILRKVILEKVRPTPKLNCLNLEVIILRNLSKIYIINGVFIKNFSLHNTILSAIPYGPYQTTKLSQVKLPSFPVLPNNFKESKKIIFWDSVKQWPLRF